MVFEVTFKRKAIWKVWEHYVKCLRKELGKVTKCGGIDKLRMFVHTYMTLTIYLQFLQHFLHSVIDM